MKRTASFSFGALLVAAACGAGGAPPSASETFVANLSPRNGVPPVTNAEASGSGTCTLTLDLTRDGGGKITTATAKFEIVLRGFPTTTALTGAHIHKGTAGANGDIVIDSGLAAGEVTLTTGGATITKTGRSARADVVTDLISGPAGFYCNVHSTVNADGVARGQLAKK